MANLESPPNRSEVVTDKNRFLYRWMIWFTNIVKRINENFYEREEVLQVVAERILKSPELQSLLKNNFK